MEPIDYNILKQIYLHRPVYADKFLIWITQNTTLITISFLLLYFFYTFLKKKNFKNVLFVGISILSAAIITNLIKIIIKRPRPYDVHTYLNIHQIDAGGYSFPSGHTTEVFALAAAMLLATQSFKKSIPFYLWAILIAYTRMAFGVHYPTDILGGMIVGISTPFIFYKIRFKK